MDALSGAVMRLRNTRREGAVVHSLIGRRTIDPKDNPMGLDPDNPIYWDTDR